MHKEVTFVLSNILKLDLAIMQQHLKFCTVYFPLKFQNLKSHVNFRPDINFTLMPYLEPLYNKINPIGSLVRLAKELSSTSPCL